MGFSKTFSLDQTVDVEKFTWALKNGVLTVSAPKDLAKLEENVRRIPVMSASAAATVDDDAAEPAIASGDTESDSQKMEHKEDAEAEEASMDLDKEGEETSSEKE